MKGLVFHQVVKRFTPDGPPVLDGLSATIEPTGLTFVVGRSGSGKSVLCRLAVGLIRPDAGTVSLLGEPVHLLPERKLRALRATVPYLIQGPALLDWLSLRSNVALASAGSMLDGRAQAALEQVGLGTLGDRLPPQVGPGVKKRTAIARALVLAPKWLLLDEPTTGLDRDAAAQVNQALLQVKRTGVGAIVVSHDYEALQSMADEVIEVSDGRIGYQGPPAGFFQRRTNLAEGRRDG